LMLSRGALDRNTHRILAPCRYCKKPVCLIFRRLVAREAEASYVAGFPVPLPLPPGPPVRLD
jgi:hypothetical protein